MSGIPTILQNFTQIG